MHFIPSEATGWRRHPDWAGVWLRERLSTAAAGGCSALEVHLEPGATIRPHRHPGRREWHYVLDGGGECRRESGIQPYSPGAAGLMGENEEHDVTAGPEGLSLLAVFVPGL